MYSFCANNSENFPGHAFLVYYRTLKRQYALRKYFACSRAVALSTTFRRPLQRCELVYIIDIVKLLGHRQYVQSESELTTNGVGILEI
jgi:hypothetical protein